MSRIRAYDFDTATLSDDLVAILDSSGFTEAQKATLSELFAFFMGKMSGDSSSLGAVTVSAAGVVKVAPYASDESANPVFYDDAADPSGSDEVKFGGQLTASKLRSIGDGDSESGWVAGSKAKVFYNASTGTYGLAVQLINDTGATSVYGTLVAASPDTDLAFVLENNMFDTIGIVLESGIEDGELCWVQVQGVADALFEDGKSAVRGYVCIAAATDGRANNVEVPSGAPATTDHWKEVGHVVQSVASGTNITAKVVLHFN